MIEIPGQLLCAATWLVGSMCGLRRWMRLVAVVFVRSDAGASRKLRCTTPQKSITRRGCAVGRQLWRLRRVCPFSTTYPGLKRAPSRQSGTWFEGCPKTKTSHSLVGRETCVGSRLLTSSKLTWVSHSTNPNWSEWHCLHHGQEPIATIPRHEGLLAAETLLRVELG